MLEPIMILQFMVATLLPVVAAVLFVRLQQRTRFGRLGRKPQQLVIGIVFGIIAIIGTEVGIQTHDATMNVRDAAPLVAGLFFGGPAGIIAGLIGGIERWFSVLWGRGMYTRLACSLATAASGFYAAGIRRFLLDDQRPRWPIALSSGVVAEVLHLLLVLVTNLDSSTQALRVVQACAPPMIFCNGVSVGLASLAVAFASGDKGQQRRELPAIAQRVQQGMLRVVLVGLLATVACVAVLQTAMSVNDAQDVLEQTLHDVSADISDASDENLLGYARRVAATVPSASTADSARLTELVEEFNLSEAHVIDGKGIIVASNVPAYLGFDMSSGAQSAEFLALLPDGTKTELVQSYQPISIDASIFRKYAGVRIGDGFVQVGYDAALFTNDLINEVHSAVGNRHVGSNGFIVVLSDRDELIGTRSDLGLKYDEVRSLASAIANHDEQQQLEIDLRGEQYLAIYGATEGMKAIALIPTLDAMKSRDLSVITTSFMEAIVLAALFAAIYVLIKSVVVENIWRVNGRLDEITQGDLHVEVDVCDSSEFASLSDDINATVGALRDAIAAESRRIERDLATAKAIQESALPRTFPPFPEIKAFDIYASMNTAREVGGDFYDFFLVNDHTLCFLIADVSGKGIPASLFMMAAKSELSNNIKTGMQLSEAVRNANQNLCHGNDAGMFVTVWAATLDFFTGELTYVNAGHNYPLMRHNGTWQWLDKKCGLFLGTFETAKYRQETIMLVPHDQILLYTDGVNEAFSVDEEEYGNDRLEAFLQDHAQAKPRTLVNMLVADVREWADGAEQSDDITMLCLEFGTPPEDLE